MRFSDSTTSAISFKTRSTYVSFFSRSLAVFLGVAVFAMPLAAQAQNKSKTNAPAKQPTKPAGKQASTPVPKPVTGGKPTPAPVVPSKPTVTELDAEGKVRLEHKLLSGEQVRMKTMHHVNTLTRIQGVEDQSEARSASIKVWEVKSIDAEGNMTFEYRIESADMMQKQHNSDEVTYNSLTDTEAPKEYAKFAEMIAKPIATITINKAGKVIERSGAPKMPNMGYGELAVPLPEEPVAIGATWELPREVRVKLEDGTEKKIKIRELYRLEKVSAGIATISVESQPITPVVDSTVESQLCQQMSAGKMKFDIDNGRMISKQLDWDKEVVGFRGADSGLKYSSRYTEELITEQPRTATRPTQRAK